VYPQSNSLFNAKSGDKKVMKHPNDENGDVLRRMEFHGDDLTQPRDIDFTVVFLHVGDANAFADHFRELGYATSARFSEVRPDFPWDIVVVRRMIPSHSEIGSFEDLLQKVADTFGGHNDGRGCFSVPSPPSQP
jgi:hypothetical protein